MVSNELKQALAYLRSIDVSLGRIATALEDRNMISETILQNRGRIKNEEDNISDEGRSGEMD